MGRQDCEAINRESRGSGADEGETRGAEGKRAVEEGTRRSGHDEERQANEEGICCVVSQAQLMEEGKKRAAEGKTIVIFPQATRSEVFDPAQFNTIGVKLARHAGVPVIPMALRTDFLANGRLVKDLGPIRRRNPVYFEFGEPIMEISPSGKAEHAHIVEFIRGRVSAWGGKVAEPHGGSAVKETAL